MIVDAPPIVRCTRPPADALEWERDLLAHLEREGFLTGGVDGRPPSSEDDWHAVADELGRLHTSTLGWPQRPGCCCARQLLTRVRGGDVDLVEMPSGAVTLMRAAWAELPDGPDAVVHGDPGPRNVRLTVDGRVALLGWDDARVDCPWFDLADLPVRRLRSADAAVAGAASHAWEAAHAWSREPNYARWRLDLLAGCRSRPS